MPEMEISVVFYLSTLRYINIYLLDELSHFFFDDGKKVYKSPWNFKSSLKLIFQELRGTRRYR